MYLLFMENFIYVLCATCSCVKSSDCNSSIFQVTLNLKSYEKCIIIKIHPETKAVVR